MNKHRPAFGAFGVLVGLLLCLPSAQARTSYVPVTFVLDHAYPPLPKTIESRTCRFSARAGRDGSELLARAKRAGCIKSYSLDRSWGHTFVDCIRRGWVQNDCEGGGFGIVHFWDVYENGVYSSPYRAQGLEALRIDRGDTFRFSYAAVCCYG